MIKLTMNKNKKSSNKDWKKDLVGFENKIEVFVTEKTPKLPEGIAKFLVKYGPYFILLGLIFSIPFILASVGLGALIPAALLGGVRAGYAFSVWNIFGLVTILLEIFALQGLFKKKLSAWRLLFYVSLVSALSALLNFQLGSLIIGTALSWYFLFQIKKYYK